VRSSEDVVYERNLNAPPDRPNKMETRTRASVAASVADLMSTPLLADGLADELLSSMSLGGNMVGVEEAKAYLQTVSG